LVDLDPLWSRKSVIKRLLIQKGIVFLIYGLRCKKTFPLVLLR